MTHSSKATALVTQFEGCKLEAYRDQAGVWTIGYGHTCGVFPGMTCEQHEALQWLNADLVACDAAVNRLIDVKLTQNQFDALVDFVYNLGAGALEHSTLRTLVNKGLFLAAAAEFLKWDHIDGKPSDGLLRRRTAERDLFLEGAL